MTAKRPVRRIGQNSFVCKNTAVIIRYATRAELELIRTIKPQNCAYVIDDDLSLLDLDSSLPMDYRNRLSVFKTGILPEILQLSDTIIAPNALICESYGDKTCLLLDPSYTSLCDDFSHFDEPGKIDMVFSGTRSHLDDLEFIAEAVLAICKRYKHVSFTTFLGKYAPGNLQDTENIIHRRPVSWKEFKRNQKKQFFHIALAPYKDTRFNRARSINKLFDHAAFGAAGIYSDMPPLSTAIEHGKEGLLIREDTGAWYTAMENLITRPEKAHYLAMAGAKRAGSLGDPARVRRFWCEYLQIE